MTTKRHYNDGTTTTRFAPVVHHHTRTGDGFDDVAYERQVDARRDAIRLQHKGFGHAGIEACYTGDCFADTWVAKGDTNLTDPHPPSPNDGGQCDPECLIRTAHRGEECYTKTDDHHAFGYYGP